MQIKVLEYFGTQALLALLGKAWHSAFSHIIKLMLTDLRLLFSKYHHDDS